MKIYNQKHGTLTEQERIDLARLLIKAGYTVRIGREKPNGNEKAPWQHYVECIDEVRE